jgi:UDP:flavonoid glycosyltransferase YjiC (YdhE family)
MDEGAALIIPAAELTPGKLRTALTRVLDEPSFAEAARRIRAGTLSLPNPNEAIPILERLTTEAISAHRA